MDAENSALRRGLERASRALLRPPLQALREMPVHGARLRQRGQGPHALFLPAYGPEGAALLRIYNVARALRGLGWASSVLPPALGLGQRRRLIAGIAPDIVVMQGARHPLNRPGLYGARPVFYDLDDADFHLAHLAGPVRRAMGQVAGVIAGSDYIARWCLAAGAPTAPVVWTGTRPLRRVWPAQNTRPPVIAWAQTRPMTYRREAGLVRRVVARIGAARPVTLRLFDRQPGDDPGFAAGFRSSGVTVEWIEKRPFRDYMEAFSDVALGLAPLCPEAPFVRGKSFGKVLAYLEAQVPVIASAAGEHDRFFRADTGVITNDEDRWVAAALVLLADGAARGRLAQAAHEAFLARLTLDRAAARIDRILRAHLAQGGQVRNSA